MELTWKRAIGIIITSLIIIFLLSCSSAKPGEFFTTNYQYTSEQVVKPLRVFVSDTLIWINGQKFPINHATHRGSHTYYNDRYIFIFTGEDLILKNTERQKLITITSLRLIRGQEVIKR